MNYKRIILFWTGFLLVASVAGQTVQRTVSEAVMQDVYNKIKTPYKYGLVMVSQDDSRKMDCPTIFREGKDWYMVYIIYDGRGYETWLAQSSDLLQWKSRGKIMSFTDTTTWDSNQKAGYISLQDMNWGGNYAWQQYNNRYWMSYFGGSTRGYEAGLLSIGIASTQKDPATVHEWNRLPKPVLKSTDADARWSENATMYKSSVIWDKRKLTGHPFVMYYNAKGDSLNKARGAERINMAVSDDMTHWQRFGKGPVINHNVGISGDAVIQNMGNLYVMFYFGAFWAERKGDGAFNRFACSYDLVNWTDWTGADLIRPSEPYDETFAHKSCVIKYNGVVYHFYCAVNKKDQRGIAVATSTDMGKSKVQFPQ